MKKTVIVLSLLFIFASLSYAVPVEVNYQGYLTDTNGVPVDGTTNMTFRLYDVDSGGSSLWDSGAVSVDVANGVYSIILGDTSVDSTQPPIDPAIFTNQLWLSVEIESDGEMTPRQKLTAAGYSINAVTAESVAPTGQGPGSLLDADTLDGQEGSFYRDWNNLINVPTYLTDGDDDTTYSAGTGLDLTDTTFDVSVPLELSGTGTGIIRGTETSSGNYGYLGGDLFSIYGFRPSSNYGPDKTSVYGWRQGSMTEAEGGSDWSVHGVDSAVKGYSVYGNNYSAAVSGYSYLDYNESTSVIGSKFDGSIMGMLAYKDSSGNQWGVYTPNDSYVGGDQTVQGAVSATSLSGDGSGVTNVDATTIGGYTVEQIANLAPTQIPRSNIITTVDSVGDVGHYTSITIGADGNPVICYKDQSAATIKVAKCNDPACSGGDETITAIDDVSKDFGIYSSIAIGADGYPVMSYHDGTAYTLKVAKCNDPACSGGDETITTVDGLVNHVGDTTSITIGTDGFPVISYRDMSAGALKVTKCNDPACSGGDETITTVDGLVDYVGVYSSIAIGTDGNPVISYHDGTAYTLKVAKCNDPACSGGDETITTVDPVNITGFHTSITIGMDGYPVISYQDVTDGALKVAKCNDHACSGGDETITTVDNTAEIVGTYSSITIGNDGYPIVSYMDSTNGVLKMAKCNDPACANGDELILVLDVDYVGAFPSITIGTDGNPVISYLKYSSGDLKVLKCANAFCINNWTRR